MKTRFKIIPKELLLAIFLTPVLYSCGGGGGDSTTATDATDTPLAYIGNTEPAVLTAANAKYLTDLLFGSSDSFFDDLDDPVDSSTTSVSSTAATVTALSRSTRELVTAVTITQQAIDELVSCADSGTVHITGTVESNMSGNLIMDFDHCDDGDSYIDGVARFVIRNFDIYLELFTDATLSSDLLHFADVSSDVTWTGSMSVLVDIPTATETINSNLIIRENATGRLAKTENLEIKTTYDNLFNPTSHQEEVKGLLFDELEGYVILSTESALTYGDPTQQFPYGGGPLYMAGANDARLRITPISVTEISIDLDADGDGVFEALAVTEWLALTEADDTTDNTVPIADAGSDMTAKVGNAVTLDGTASSDADGDFIWFSWAIIQKPVDSTAAILDNADSPFPDFIADVPGTYTISLTVNDGITTSTASTAVVNAYQLHGLGYRVVDAEYSPQLERLVMVSSTPPTLHVFDADTNTETTVSLPLPPAAVSVGPDGTFAAIAHDGWISYVNLVTPALVDTLSVSADVLDVVLAGNGYVYAFPRVDQWERIRAIEIATGTETLHEGNSIYAGTKAKLHPAGLTIYGANNGLSPSDIEKYSIENGTPVYLYDSPYHGDYAMCGDLWIMEDGLSIVTKCGNVFRSSTIQEEDMTYRGSLSTIAEQIEHADHSAEINEVAVIPQQPLWWSDANQSDSEVHFFDSTFLALRRTAQIPSLSLNETNYPLHGRFVYYSDNGELVTLVVQSDPEAGLLYDFFILRL